MSEPLVCTAHSRSRLGLAGCGSALAERIERRWRPISAGVAVPAFAFFAAGVTLIGAGALVPRLTRPVTVAIVVALVVGKTIGVLAATWATRRLTRAELSNGLRWWDVVGVALLAGIGFTVSLLIGEVAFGAGSDSNDQAKIGILLGCWPRSGCECATGATDTSVRRRTRRRRYPRHLPGRQATAGITRPVRLKPRRVRVVSSR